jgi:hypothetical protein
MTFYAFRLLSPVVQLYWVIHHGGQMFCRRTPAGLGTQGRAAGSTATTYQSLT